MGNDRKQAVFFPPCKDNLIPGDSEVRSLDSLLSGFDYAEKISQKAREIAGFLTYTHTDYHTAHYLDFTNEKHLYTASPCSGYG